MGFSGMDWRNMFGGLADGAAKDLGYQNLYVQKKPNAAPTPSPLPSHQGVMDLMGHGQPGMSEQVMMQPMHPIDLNAMGMFGNPVPIRTYAYGGSLDPHSLNIVSDDEHITKDGKVVSTGDNEDKAKRQAHEDAIATTLGKAIQAAQQVPQTQSSPQDQAVSPPPSESGIYMNQITPATHGQIGFTAPPMTLGQQAPTSQAPSITGNPIVRVPTLNGPDLSTLVNNVGGSTPNPSLDTAASSASNTSAGIGDNNDPYGIKDALAKQSQEADIIKGILSQKPTQTWKSALYGGLQGFSNAANHTNNPIQTWDQARQNRQLAREMPKYQLAQQQYEGRLGAYKTAAEAKRWGAMGDYYGGRNATALEIAQQKQQGITDRLKQSEEFKSGAATPQIDGNGMVWAVYKNGPNAGTRKPWVDEDGHQARTFTPIDWEDPRTHKVIQLKPGEAAKNDTAIVAEGNRTDLANRRLTLDTEKFTQSKAQFQQTMDLRVKAEQRLEQAQARQDQKAVDQAQKDLEAADARIDKMQEYMDTHADLTEEQKADLGQLITNARSRKHPVGGNASGNVKK